MWCWGLEYFDYNINEYKVCPQAQMIINNKQKINYVKLCLVVFTAFLFAALQLALSINCAINFYPGVGTACVLIFGLPIIPSIYTMFLAVKDNPFTKDFSNKYYFLFTGILSYMIFVISYILAIGRVV